MGIQTTWQLVERWRASAVAIEGQIADLRRLHPERMTEHDWRDLRIDYLATLEALHAQILLTIELLEREDYRERSYPRRDYPPAT